MAGVMTPFSKVCVFGGGNQDWLVNLKIRFCFSLLNRLIQDTSDYGASKERKNRRKARITSFF